MSSDSSHLRADCLNFWEVLAQSIAMLGPTLTPVLIVPLMFGVAGNGSWVAYAFGTLMLLAVALNLNKFAQRSPNAGSLYAYAVAAFGPRGSVLCGWALLWAYVFVGTAGLAAFALFSSRFLGGLGITVAPLALVCVCLGLIWALAYRDIRLSTITLLIIEACVAVLVGWLILQIFWHRGIYDAAQFAGPAFSLPAIGAGTVIAIFSAVGFESATSLGEEAHEPRFTIPAAVIWSVILAGAFFTVATYAEVLGMRNYGIALDKLTTPLDQLSEVVGSPQLKVPIDVGAMLSAFSVALAALNAGARVVLSMGRSGLFPAQIGDTHPTHQTPHKAIAAFALAILAVAAGLLLLGRTPSDAFNDTASLGSFGFVAIYLSIVVGAPLYLRRLGELRPADVAISALGVAFLLVPTIGSVYPPPAPPANVFPLYFLAYMAAGVGLLWLRAGCVRADGMERAATAAPAASTAEAG